MDGWIDFSLCFAFVSPTRPHKIDIVQEFHAIFPDALGPLFPGPESEGAIFLVLGRNGGGSSVRFLVGTETAVHFHPLVFGGIKDESDRFQAQQATARQFFFAVIVSLRAHPVAQLWVVAAELRHQGVAVFGLVFQERSKHEIPSLGESDVFVHGPRKSDGIQAQDTVG